MTGKKPLFVILVAVLFLAASCGPETGKPGLGDRDFLFLRSHISGTYYSAGSAWARLITSKTRFIGVNSTAHSTENEKISMLAANTIQIAFLKGPEINLAYSGDPVYWEGPQPVKAMFGLWPAAYTLIAHKSSDISAIDDIKGKSIAIDSNGSVTGDILEYLLGLYGINETNTSIYRVRDSIGMKMFLAGDADCVWYDLGYGEKCLRSPFDSFSGSFTEMENFNLVPVAADLKFREFLKVYPYFYIDVYGNELDLEDKNQLMTLSIAICPARMPEETAYTLTRLWWENQDFIRQYVPGMLELINKDDNRKGVPVPFHEGALRYLSEAGLVPGHKK